MTATRQDLVHEALRNLGALPEGNSPNPEDYVRVDNRITSVLSELDGEDICYVPDPEQIPDNLLLPLADIVAEACASAFGAQGDVGIVAAATAARMQICRIESQPYDGSINRATHF